MASFIRSSMFVIGLLLVYNSFVSTKKLKEDSAPRVRFSDSAALGASESPTTEDSLGASESPTTEDSLGASESPTTEDYSQEQLQRTFSTRSKSDISFDEPGSESPYILKSISYNDRPNDTPVFQIHSSYRFKQTCILKKCQFGKVTKYCKDWIPDPKYMPIDDYVLQIEYGEHYLVQGYFYAALLHKNEKYYRSNYCSNLNLKYTKIQFRRMIDIRGRCSNWFILFGYNVDESNMTKLINERNKALDIYLPHFILEFILLHSKNNNLTYIKYCERFLNIELEHYRPFRLQFLFPVYETLVAHICEAWLIHANEQLKINNHFLVTGYNYSKLLPITKFSNPDHYCSTVYRLQKRIDFAKVTDVELSCKQWFLIFGFTASEPKWIKHTIDNRNKSLDIFLPNIILSYIEKYTNDNNPPDYLYFCVQTGRNMYNFFSNIMGFKQVENDTERKDFYKTRICKDWISEPKRRYNNDYITKIEFDAHYLELGYYYYLLLHEHDDISRDKYCNVIHPDNKEIQFLKINEIEFTCERWFQIYGYNVDKSEVMQTIKKRNITLDQYLPYLIRNFIDFNQQIIDTYSYKKYCQTIGYTRLPTIFVDAENIKMTCTEYILFFGYTHFDNHSLYHYKDQNFQSNTFITIDVAIYNHVLCNDSSRAEMKNVCNKMYGEELENISYKLKSIHNIYLSCTEWVLVVAYQYINDTESIVPDINYVEVTKRKPECDRHIHIFAVMWLDFVKRLSYVYSITSSGIPPKNSQNYHDYHHFLSLSTMQSFCATIGTRPEKLYPFVYKGLNMDCKSWLGLIDLNDDVEHNTNIINSIDDSYYLNFNETYPDVVRQYIISTKRYAKQKKNVPTVTDFCSTWKPV